MRDDHNFRQPALEDQTYWELEEMLRTELEKKQPNREYVLRVLDILESRDSGNSANSGTTISAKRKDGNRTHWLKKAIAVAAVILIFVYLAPPAFGAENIVELVGRWTQSIFSLFRTDDSEHLQTEYAYTTSNPDLQTVYDTVVKHGITQPVVPSWLPAGCELSRLDVTDNPTGVSVSAYFQNDNHILILSIELITEQSLTKYPKECENARIYEIEGRKHYILLNDDAWIAVWTLDGIVCSIVTDYSENEVYRIIKTIYMEES